MNFIHVVKTLPRVVDDALAARLRVMPAVVLTGARQTGKSTLVEKRVPGERRYRSLDNFDVRDAARRDPEALLGGNDPLTLAYWRTVEWLTPDVLAVPWWRVL
jgi:predicted AAA+ superfamily ATPase